MGPEFLMMRIEMDKTVFQHVLKLNTGRARRQEIFAAGPSMPTLMNPAGSDLKRGHGAGED